MPRQRARCLVPEGAHLLDFLAVEVVDSPAVVAVVADFLADNYYFVIVNIYDRI